MLLVHSKTRKLENRVGRLQLCSKLRPHFQTGTLKQSYLLSDAYGRQSFWLQQRGEITTFLEVMMRCIGRGGELADVGHCHQLVDLLIDGLSDSQQVKSLRGRYKPMRWCLLKHNENRGYIVFRSGSLTSGHRSESKVTEHQGITKHSACRATVSDTALYCHVLHLSTPKAHFTFITPGLVKSPILESLKKL